MKVYVDAWEYVNPGPNAGGGGFDWYYTRAAAQKAYAAELETTNPDWAHFYFEVDLPAGCTEPEAITDWLGYCMDDFCASAGTRYVGANVARYWQQNNMAMGAA